MEFVQPIRDKRKIALMKEILKEKSMRDYCLFVLGINSGLRISDLLNLKIGDAFDGVHPKDRISLREQKTGKERDFPLGSTARAAICEYLQTMDNVDADKPLFPSRKGESPISRQQAYRILNDAARQAGIKDKIGTHTLRKTFGYHAYKCGIDITVLQQLLNHSAPSVTLRYIGITRDDLDNVYKGLNL